MPSYSGVWNLASQLQAIAGQNWPMGPGAPTSVSATSGDNSATVTFVAPSFTGVPPGITGYLATSTPGSFTTTGASSPLTVTGLTNGTSYTIAVQATNGVQYGPSGTSGSVTPATPLRALFAGGRAFGDTATTQNIIQYITITSTGNSTDFGDLTSVLNQAAGFGSATRSVFSGGQISSNVPENVIQYVTSSTTGNATDFGDLTLARYGLAGLSNSTRGVSAGGNSSASTNSNVIDYVTIASVGNATDFGDLPQADPGRNGQRSLSACASSTRGLFFGGDIESFGRTNSIIYITISSTGNGADFGDLTFTTSDCSSCSSSTRGLIAIGFGSGYPTNTIEYVTIASTGNATDFGDAITASSNNPTMAAASSEIRAVFAGGAEYNVNVIQYFTIASTGNGTDFGDLVNVNSAYMAGTSNCHGGL